MSAQSECIRDDDETVAAFVEGGLMFSASLIIVEHLKVCSQCREYVEDFRTFLLTLVPMDGDSQDDNPANLEN